MPVVGLYGGQKVESSPYPNVQKTAAETPLSSGVGLDEANIGKAESLAHVGGTLATVGAGLANIGIKEKEEAARRADQIKDLATQNALAAWTTDALHNPETGALNVHGLDALNSQSTVMAAYDKFAGGIEQGLTTDRQKLAFMKAKGSHALNIQLALEQHASTEAQRYHANELTSFVENQRSAAVASAGDDPASVRRVGDAITAGITAIRTHAPQVGLGPEEVKHQIDTFTTASLSGVVEELLAQNKPGAAKAYYEETKDQIKGEARARLEKALEVGGNRSEAQKLSDAILNEGGTLAEAREKVKARSTGQVRDEALQYLEHEFTVQGADLRAREEARMRKNYDVLDQTHDVTRIAPADWAAMTGGERSAARSYADKLAAGVKVETDWATYYSRLDEAAAAPDDFAKRNLLADRAKLSDAEFKQLSEIRAAIVKGDRVKAEQVLAGPRTENEIISDSLINYKLDPKALPSTTQGKANAELRRLVGQDIAVLEQKTGHKATNADIQSTVDRILSTSVKVPGSWWGFLPGYSFGASSKSLITLSIDDVPKDQQAIITRQLQAAGRPVSPATILAAFQKDQARPK